MSKDMRQMPELSGRTGVANVEAGRDPTGDEACGTSHEHQGTGSGTLLEAALTRENLQAAWKRVKANKGAAGVDGLDIEHMQCQLRTKWPLIRQELLAGRYRPSPVRRGVPFNGDPLCRSGANLATNWLSLLLANVLLDEVDKVLEAVPDNLPQNQCTWGYRRFAKRVVWRGRSQ